MTGSPSRLNQLCHFGNSLSFTETDSRSIFDQYEPISELVKYSKLPVEDFSFPFLTPLQSEENFQEMTSIIPYFCIYEKDYEQYVKLGTPLEEADIINRFEIRLAFPTSM